VFLIGGQTRHTEPVPILLRSGDVVIMSGPTCRRAYHGSLQSILRATVTHAKSGVPRILDGTLPPHLRSEALQESEKECWAPYGDYMRTTRINVNVRQVFPKGFDPDVAAGSTVRVGR
jgi:alkylated DNA repair protein alkB family protein 1